MLGRVTARFAPTAGLVFVRGETPPLAWLDFAGEPVPVDRCALLRTGTGVRLLLFDDSRPQPTRVVVVGASAHDPGPVQATAAAAGARVPEALALANLGGLRIRVESAVPGALAAAHLQKEPADLARILGLLADWLARWHAATAHATPSTPELVDARLVRPARECRDMVGDAYVARVEAAAARLVGRTVDLVDAHCDLTMWNVFVDGAGSRLGVIDWETAETGSFPVADFVYAAVDAASAFAGYGDRAAAFDRCFTPGGELAPELDRLVRRVAAAASVGPDLLPAVFHASFLRHAANERRAPAPGGEAPFRKIAARLAKGGLAAWAALEMLS